MKSIVYFFSVTLVFLGLLTSCQHQSSATLKVAATAIPHAEILEQVKPILKEKGIDLEIIVVEDYNTPNRALNDKEVDANFFQHRPFLDMQIKEFGYDLKSLTAVHLEPMALYSKKISHLENLKAGATVAIPSDPTNQARALCLLENSGLIQLSRHDCTATLFHVINNPHQLKLIEIDSPLLCRALDDVDLAAITTNFALQASFSPQEQALAMESALSEFVNILVIRSKETERPDLITLKEALNSGPIRRFIEKTYKGAIISVF